MYRLTITDPSDPSEDRQKTFKSLPQAISCLRNFVEMGWNVQISHVVKK